MIAEQPVLHNVLILADESANWRIAGLPQLHRILLSLNEYATAAGQTAPVSVCVSWKPGTPAASRLVVEDQRLTRLEVTDCEAEEGPFDLVLSTRVFLYRNGIAAILEAGVLGVEVTGSTWHERLQDVRRTLRSSAEQAARTAIAVIPTAAKRSGGIPRRTPWIPPRDSSTSLGMTGWQYVADPAAIGSVERAFLRENGKSQDGLISKYLNRPISRWISRLLLKTEIVPSTWSVIIFSLPLAACVAFLQGTPMSFVIGCVIFQLYSIVDGCDGEIARSRFMHSDFGRRLDSLLDLTGNMLLAICLGIGLALHALPSLSLSWFYVAEGVAAAACVVLSEGIVFLRRSRGDQPRTVTPLNGALYQRHHELFQRSGILVFGENVVWWLVFMTKRDMAMLAFVVLALVGQPEWILHLLLGVGAINSALAGNAFLRAPAPAIQQEAS